MKYFTVLALFVTSIGIFISSPTLARDNGTGLETSVAIDTVGKFKLGKESKASDSLNVREAEMSFFAPIDHRFDGILSLAAHREKGVSVFELHEATIKSDKLIPDLSFRIGQFFLGVGRLNRVHRHDWPFISAPKVFSEFFDHEGVIDSGAEFSYLTPFSFFFEITFGVTNGWTYGHSHDEGKKPKVPTHYFRIGSFIDDDEDFGFAFGLNYLGREDSDESKMQLIGLDGVAKGMLFGHNYLIQSEIWHRKMNPKIGDEDRSIGAYLFPQVHIGKGLDFGMRFDYFTVTSLVDVSGNKQSNADYSLVPTMSYSSSEFATFKLAYNHTVNTQQGRGDVNQQSIELQSVFILGAHPAHDF